MIPEVVKLFLKGEGEVGIQLVRRGGVDGNPPRTFPGDEDDAIVSCIRAAECLWSWFHGGGRLTSRMYWCAGGGGANDRGLKTLHFLIRR
jgi:hypothetical protein